jgi:beta-N-acetylhexosaminidase
MVMIWVLGDYTSTSDSSFVAALDRIEIDRVGGVVMSLGSPIEVAAKVNALQARSRIPLLVASDVEPGLGRLEGGVFTPGCCRAARPPCSPATWPSAPRDARRTREEAGRITGAESRAIGIHLAFAPTVDVNNNPLNPVINVRSFGEDADAVSRLSVAFVRGRAGRRGRGDGQALPRARRHRHRLAPRAADRGRGPGAARFARAPPLPRDHRRRRGGVMSAHIALPAVSGDSTPATLVPAIMTGLLRDTLGFRGLTVTDAMDMRGVGAGYGVEESAVRAVMAGTDILLMPPDIPTAIAAVVAAVERGEITPARIDASVRRILELKVRTGAMQRLTVPLDSLRMTVGSAEHRAAAQRIADDAVTLLRNDERQFPFTGADPTVLLTFSGENDVSAGRAFAAEVRQAIPRTRVARITPSTPRARLDSLVRDGERVLLATFVRTIEGEGRFAVGEHVARWVDSLATQRAVSVVAFSNPYVIREFPQVSGYVATFGRGAAMERAAARAVTGQQPFTGRAPISLPAFFRIGSGIVTGAPAGRVTDVSLADTVRAVLERGVRDSVFPGAIAVIGDRTGIVAEVAAGRIDWAPDAPAPDARTVWDIASLTKVVGMTTGMMQLVEQERVALDAPVQRYLPEWQGRGKERVTVRHLLTHTGGLRPFRQLWKEVADSGAARRLLLETPLDSEPGTRMVYSDIGAILAGMIIERVSGLPLDRYLERHVFGPLGMADTRYLPPADWRDRIAPTERDPWRGRLVRGEVHDENAHFLGGVSAHAGLFSSAGDLARFARMLLNGGTLDGVRVVDAHTIRDFTRVQNALLSHRALGWETPNGTNSAGRQLRRPAYGHTGFTGTSIWIDPANDRFVILLTNRVNPTRANSRIAPVRTTVADLAAEFGGGAGGAVPAARGTP